MTQYGFAWLVVDRVSHGTSHGLPSRATRRVPDDPGPREPWSVTPARYIFWLTACLIRPTAHCWYRPCALRSVRRRAASRHGRLPYWCPRSQRRQIQNRDPHSRHRRPRNSVSQPCFAHIQPSCWTRASSSCEAHPVLVCFALRCAMPRRTEASAFPRRGFSFSQAYTPPPTPRAFGAD